MTLLTICEDAASQLGLRKPTAVVGSNGLTEQMLLRFANLEGDSLSRWHDWQALIVEQTFTTIAAEAQTSALPSDYDRMIYNVEIWNRTNSTRYVGPTAQRYWQRLKSNSATGAVGAWRLLRGGLNLYPTPTAGETVAFEYITKNWCESAGGDGQSAFMADTDVALVPERLMVLGIVWRFRQARGFAAYAEDMVTYEREKELAAARDRGTGRIRPESSRGDGPMDPIWDGTITE